MDKLTQKIKEVLHRGSGSEEPKSVTITAIPSIVANTFQQRLDIYRYRKQRGVNLGSWFVLERWIAEAPFRFAKAPGQSDLDVGLGSHAKEVLEGHWDTWIQDADWKWMSQKGLNTVRLPIGYYHLCGVDLSVLDQTDFKDLGSVFSGAWSRITKAIETAHRFGFGVLIDLHAAPGKQNNDPHSGTSNLATFFSDDYNKSHTIHILRTLVNNLNKFTRTHVPPLPNIVGIELLNEPNPPSDPVLKAWYTSAISDIGKLDPSLPIYLGDCWRTEQYTEYIESMASQTLTILDHHLYRCFTPSDSSTPAAQHTESLTNPNAHTPSLFKETTERLGVTGGGMIVGEWSGALSPGSLTGEPDEVKNFISAQLDLYERVCAGWFFWTYKKQRGDRGWSFRDAVEGAVLPQWVGLKVKKALDDDDKRRNNASVTQRDKALDDHIAYWSQFPGEYQHWRFAEGFIRGWDDAYSFFAFDAEAGKPVSEIGFKGAWARRRTDDHGKSYWEFDHGFSQGIDAARKDFQNFYS